MAELKDFYIPNKVAGMYALMSISMTPEERVDIKAEAEALNTTVSGYLKALHRLHMANKDAEPKQ